MRTKDLIISETKDIFVFKGTTSLYILCLYEGCSILYNLAKYKVQNVRCGFFVTSVWKC